MTEERKRGKVVEGWLTDVTDDRAEEKLLHTHWITLIKSAAQFQYDDTHLGNMAFTGRVQLLSKLIYWPILSCMLSSCLTVLLLPPWPQLAFITASRRFASKKTALDFLSRVLTCLPAVFSVRVCERDKICHSISPCIYHVCARYSPENFTGV